MPCRVELLRSAAKQFGALPKVARDRVAQAIDGLAQDPHPSGATKLQGRQSPALWRIRIGDYRVLYQIEDQVLLILVIRVAHRREAYR